MRDLEEFAGLAPSDLLDRLGMTGPPYDPFAIAEKLGVEVCTELDSFEQLEVSGEIHVKNGNIKMWINPTEVSYRRRFTAAHELGHLVHDIIPAMNSGRDLDFVDRHARDGSINPVERRANDYAAKLLMPAQKVIDEAKTVISEYKESRSDDLITADELSIELSNRFDVSKQAMQIRLRNIGIL